MLDAKEWLDVFPALDNKLRFNMLLFLCDKGPKSFSMLKKQFNITPASVLHHLDKLMDAELITNSYKQPPPGDETKEYSYYEITERGKEILKILLEEKK